LGQFGRALAQARRAYREFMEEGIGQGHMEGYYDVVDQRFLGDEEFIEKVDKRAQGWEVEAKGPKVPFSRLVEAVAQEHGIASDAFARPGRGGFRLHRDPSLMSRLYAMYQKDRDRQAEARVARWLGSK